jgi:hypothetical protein
MAITETSPEILGLSQFDFFKSQNWHDKFFRKGGTSDDVDEAVKILAQQFDCSNATANNIETSSEESDTLLITNSLNEKIDYLERYGIDWNDEDIEVGPNTMVIERLRKTIPKLVKRELIPFRIAPSIDEGACIVFQKEKVLVYLEFYNDGDIGLISEDIHNKRILENLDLNEDDLISSIERICS